VKMSIAVPMHGSELPLDPPDTLSVPDFLFFEGQAYGRHPTDNSKPPFICGITGKSYSVSQVVSRYEALARSLSVELGWEVNAGLEFDKAAAIFSLNSVSLFKFLQLFSRKSLKTESYAAKSIYSRMDFG
jgi:hypothetical protein